MALPFESEPKVQPMSYREIMAEKIFLGLIEQESHDFDKMAGLRERARESFDLADVFIGEIISRRASQS